MIYVDGEKLGALPETQRRAIEVLLEAATGIIAGEVHGFVLSRYIQVTPEQAAVHTSIHAAAQTDGLRVLLEGTRDQLREYLEGNVSEGYQA